MAIASERFWFDAFSAVLLFFTALGGAYLPKYLCSHGGHVSEAHSLAFHLGNMLSAGVMLSAGFCHLLADALRYLNFIGRFPMSNFLAATGYIITLLADQVVHAITEHQAKNSLASTGSGTGYKKLASTELTSATASKQGHSVVESSLSTAVHREHARLQSNGGDIVEAVPLSASNGQCCPTDGSKQPLLADPKARLPSQDVEIAGGHHRDDCHSGVAVLLGGGKKLSFATAVLLAAALCVHSVLEGMALGAQQNMRSTEDIMIAIAAHKGLAAYALGASIVESGANSSKFWTVIGCFSLATPIGIFAGFAMSSVASSQGGAALSALASGTFLYVAFMEVIPKELADPSHRLLKMTAFVLGYGLMSMLAIWA